MKISHLSKVVGAGVVLAGLAILPLAGSVSAQTDTPAATDTRAAQMRAYAEIHDRWMSAREFYWRGRHEWIGDGMVTQLRSSALSSRQSLTTPDAGTGSTIITPSTTTTPGTTTTPDTTTPSTK